ncbi:Leucine-rich repeats and WD repeat domain-containing protein 1 [Haplosporangium sp. Z 27]|nr:Leucine-rich repeats and WD repeat domain-containing protein 1 [Haplosporangium sp. Z 27]
MPRRKSTAIVESSSDESTSTNDQKKRGRAAASSTSKIITRNSTRNVSPTQTKSVASKATVLTAVAVPAPTPSSPVRHSKRKATEPETEEPEQNKSSSPVTTSSNTRKITTRQSNKSEPVSKPIKKDVVKKEVTKKEVAKKDVGKEGVGKEEAVKRKRATKSNLKNDSRKKNSNASEPIPIKKKIVKQIVKRKLSKSVSEIPWLYPSLLDEDSMVINESTDMDVDQSHGYVLQYILRAHSMSTHEGQDEYDNDTWAVAFQPTLPVIRSYYQPQHSVDSNSDKERDGSQSDSGEDSEDTRAWKRSKRIEREKSRRSIKSSSIVATCGGNTVCLIDCGLGRVMAKYSHVPEEEFMCLAWTTLDHHVEEDDKETGNKTDILTNDRHDQSNILAAAGRMGSIKLINPLLNTCYKYLHGHTDSIVRLKFSLTNPRWLFSASTDGTARLWDIGSLSNYQTEACCLAKFVGLDDTSVTAIGVSEKYLIVGTEKGLMAQYNLIELAKDIQDKKTIHLAKPEKIYPPSQEWHESAVDEIVYIPFFSEESYAAKKSKAEFEKSIKEGKKKRGAKGAAGRGKPVRGRGRGRGRGGSSASQRNNKNDSEDESQDEVEEEEEDEDDFEGEFVFASRENCQGEILVWEANESTESDAKLETILEWPIAESWSKFTLGENRAAVVIDKQKKIGPKEKKLQQKRQNVLVAGSTDGDIIFYDLSQKPKRGDDGNIIAEKPSNVSLLLRKIYLDFMVFLTFDV